jgi:hypothetical protein
MTPNIMTPKISRPPFFPRCRLSFILTALAPHMHHTPWHLSFVQAKNMVTTNILSLFTVSGSYQAPQLVHRSCWRRPVHNLVVLYSKCRLSISSIITSATHLPHFTPHHCILGLPFVRSDINKECNCVVFFNFYYYRRFSVLRPP